MTISQRLRTCARHTGLDAVIELLTEAADEIDALQARAILTQQPATPEPAGYLYDFKYDDEIVRDWFTQNIDEIQFRPATCLNIRPLYAHPAPSVQGDVVRDAERWRTFLATRPSNTHEVVNDAIDAAMLAAKKASA